jgi:hypothetical protein
MLIARILSAALRLAFFRIALWLRHPGAESEGASAEQLRTFFQDPANFAARSIEQIASAVGPWQEYDDWDWGRLVHVWRRPNLCVRVLSKNGVLNYVGFRNPKNLSRSGVDDEIVWERSPLEEDESR